jgi:hypothetical protein
MALGENSAKFPESAHSREKLSSRFSERYTQQEGILKSLKLSLFVIYLQILLGLVQILGLKNKNKL